MDGKCKEFLFVWEKRNLHNAIYKTPDMRYKEHQLKYKNTIKQNPKKWSAGKIQKEERQMFEHTRFQTLSLCLCFNITCY